MSNPYKPLRKISQINFQNLSKLSGEDLSAFVKKQKALLNEVKQQNSKKVVKLNNYEKQNNHSQNLFNPKSKSKPDLFINIDVSPRENPLGLSKKPQNFFTKIHPNSTKNRKKTYQNAPPLDPQPPQLKQQFFKTASFKFVPNPQIPQKKKSLLKFEKIDQKPSFQKQNTKEIKNQNKSQIVSNSSQKHNHPQKLKLDLSQDQKTQKQQKIEQQMKSQQQGFLKPEKLNEMFKDQALGTTINEDEQNETTIAQCFKNIIGSVLFMLNYKNCRYIQSLFGKLTQFNRRLREFLYFEYDSQVYTRENFTMDFLIERLIQQSIRNCIQADKTTVRKFKPDRLLLESFIDLSTRLEDLTIKHQQEQLKLIQSNLLESENTVREEIFVLEQVMLMNRKRQEFNMFRKHQQRTLQNTKRKLGHLISQQIEGEELKAGKFRYIKNFQRVNATNIDEMIQKLNDNFATYYDKTDTHSSE